MHFIVVDIGLKFIAAPAGGTSVLTWFPVLRNALLCGLCCKPQAPTRRTAMIA
jgi:hypothetical protein